MRHSSPAIFLGGDGVHYEERAPGRDLAPWIAAFWRLRCERPYPLRVLPDGCMDIIGDDVVGSLSCGARGQPRARRRGDRDPATAGAFTALYGVPAGELADLRVPLADVVRPRPLLDLVRDAPLPDPLVAAALHAPDVRALARETGYSTRHLRRRLLAQTGHSPKRLARIRRMQAVLAAGRGESWARTAAEFGFHDESHMINDIRALANATPRTLLARA